MRASPEAMDGQVQPHMGSAEATFDPTGTRSVACAGYQRDVSGS
jgi:hypothetical protein